MMITMITKRCTEVSRLQSHFFRRSILAYNVTITMITKVKFVADKRRKIIPIAVDVDGYRRLEDNTFKQHFRMNRILFEVCIFLDLSIPS